MSYARAQESKTRRVATFVFDPRVEVRLPEMDVSQLGHPTIRSVTCSYSRYRIVDEQSDPGTAMTSGDARAAAAGPALGFLFQFRFGLLQSLDRAKRNLDFVVAFRID